MPLPITPFANESDSLQIDDLTIENRTDRVSLYGSIALTKDQAGLEHARALKAVVDAVVAALEHEEHLPDAVATKPPDQVPNPFS
ncbi:MULTISPECIES: hypothetical protein [Azospirillum]|uniref:Uncharacterized protein n=1 Tax=Azospirillum formosense TaxID=861533 RepID=A0ABX2KPP7_9PROT|nr:hypothetical protein [Azospirillum formosense]MBY3753886.1 hypothetical protein [Azospirillum formosense]NUB18611.1 hypothetical protein [Azospirillum formosense]